MPANYWQKLEKAFHKASALSGEKLAHYLETLKNSDHSLYQDLSELLEQDSAHSRLASNQMKKETDAYSKPISTENVQTDPLVGEQLGAFRVVQEIAHGGMSRVYKGERVAKDFDQYSAIKVLSKQFLSDEALAGFNFERHTLASFDHPNIAKVLDGGTTEQGQPYLTMEYIEGLPIDEYCQSKQLELKDLIKLFLQLTQAVEFAHRRLVVHRDIKPSNVLVTEDGIVKLLDFGISKSIQLDSNDSQLTTIGSRPMTPAFASPEQIAGQPITIATDIYSLGVLLYKLLTEKMPYSNTGSLQLIYSICKEQPSNPSQSIYTRLKQQSTETDDSSDTVKISNGDSNAQLLKRLHRKVKGDLDNIVLHALNKKPENRYNSVNELSGDLKRFLKGEAILAKGDSSFYKIKKWAFRNKAISCLAFILLLSYTGFTSYSIWLAEQLRIESKTAQTVSDYLVNLFTVVNISKPQTEIKPNKSMTVIELLDAGKEFVMKDLVDQPEVKVRLLNSMADAYQGMGDYKSAEKIIDETIQLQQSLNISDIQLADSLNISGWNKYSAGKYRQALLAFSKALTLKIDRPTYYQSLQNVATAQTALALFEQAKENYQKVIEYNNSLSIQNEEKNAAALHNYAILLWELGEYQKAREIELKVLDIFVRNYGAESSHASDAYNFLGTLSKYTDNDHVAALEYYNQSLAIDRTLYPGLHQSIAYGLLDIGALYHEAANYQKALDSFEEARDIFIAIFGQDNLEVGNALNSIADIHFDFGQIPKALEIYNSALTIYQKHNSNSNPSKSIVIHNIAESNIELFQYQMALELIHSDLNDLVEILPREHPQLRSMRATLFKIYVKLGKEELAQEILNLLNSVLLDSNASLGDISLSDLLLGVAYWQSIDNQVTSDNYLSEIKLRLSTSKSMSFTHLELLIDCAERLFNSNQLAELETLLPHIEDGINHLDLTESLLTLKQQLLLAQLHEYRKDKGSAHQIRSASQKLARKLGFGEQFVSRFIQHVYQRNSQDSNQRQP